MVVLAVLVCLRLGRWQWDRMHEGGTVQNLGYAILWPVFGAAFIYMWFRFLQLELLKDSEDDAELTRLASGESDDEPGADAGPSGGPVDPPLAGVALQDRAGTAAQRSGPDRTAPAPDGPDADDDGGIREGDPGLDPSTAVEPAPDRASSRRTPSRGITVAVATVGDEDENEDPELAAYNRALAALAEKDHRRAS